jgi:hypothetical protein
MMLRSGAFSWSTSSFALIQSGSRLKEVLPSPTWAYSSCSFGRQGRRLFVVTFKCSRADIYYLFAATDSRPDNRAVRRADDWLADCATN